MMVASAHTQPSPARRPAARPPAAPLSFHSHVNDGGGRSPWLVQPAPPGRRLQSRAPKAGVREEGGGVRATTTVPVQRVVVLHSPVSMPIQQIRSSSAPPLLLCLLAHHPATG